MFLSVLAAEPGSAAAERMLGRIAMEESDVKEASLRLERARELEPDHVLGQYFALFALWRSAGDAPAIERIDDLAGRGVPIGFIVRTNRADWAAAGPDLSRALDALAD